ncbi:MAG: aldo/keto reductase [Planctomycetes bacterium]|nr:aldo/keto reductase [Planctomycetota bacterium]
MEHRQLGRSGLRVSSLCLGTMNFGGLTDEPTAIRMVQEAFERGVNFFDTANVYGRGCSEEILGKAVQEGGLRDKVVLATKVVADMGDGPNERGASRYHIMQQCEASLRRLRTDRIDLYQLHIVDFTSPTDESMRALDTLVRQGKVLYLGTSKHPIALIMEGLALSERYGYERFVSEQPPYNLLDRTIENELVWTCLRHGIGIIPWAPLATGMLSGQYRSDAAPPEASRAAKGGISAVRLHQKALAVVEKLKPLAQARGVSLAEFSLAWVINQPGITAPIFGPRTPEQLQSALKATDLKLTPDELSAIDQIAPPGTAVSNYYDGNVYARLRQEVKAR